MSQTQKTRAIGLLLVILGITTSVVGIVTILETRWVVDPLRYTDVRYVGGFRNSATIHIIATDGRTYRLPRRLWPDEVDGAALAARLAEERTAVAHVSGGEHSFWFGYPTVDYFETPTLTLQAPPLSRARASVALILGPLLAAGGVLFVRQHRRS